VTQAGWRDIAHLSPEAIETLKAAIPPHQIEARMNGTPTLGSGAIFPVSEDSFVVPDFEMPAFWPRAFGLDVGWQFTACIWLAWDRDSDVVYFYSEHKAGAAIPAVHAAAIKARGSWIPGVVDPASQGANQVDGLRLLDLYRAEGLDLEPADNSVEAGIYATWQRLVSGKLKVFQSLTNWLSEFRRYRRDDKGKVVKTHDHCLDSGRYALMSGLERAKTPPLKRSPYAIGSGGRVFSG
jgi:Terminase RNaseH-like domain